MLSFDVLQAREAATYSWPWVKHGTERSTPMALNAWPCDLFIDTEKHGFDSAIYDDEEDKEVFIV